MINSSQDSIETTKKVNGEIQQPVIDSEKIDEQWESFVEYMKQWITYGQIRTFRPLLRKAYKLEKSNEYFAKNHSEILKMLKICEVTPLSTAEVERVMSTLKRILSEKRTGMTDKHLEACVMISHESRRRYGGMKNGESLSCNRS